MSKSTYFSFTSHGRRFSINATYIEEVFSLPEILLLSEAAQDIIGALNLRGEILPILDLNISLGAATSDYHLSDSVIVLNQDQLRVGIIVNAVHSLETAALEDVPTESSNHPDLADVKRKHMIAGLVQDPHNTLILEGPESWLQYVEVQQVVSMASLLDVPMSASAELNPSSADGDTLLQRPIFFPEASPADREILRQRADSLRQPLTSPETGNLKTLSVISLGGQLFGINLDLVQEFIELSNVTPIPCCPPSIVGNLNLRGDVLTVIDIRSLMNLPINPMPKKSQAIVLEADGITAGVAVEHVLESMFLLNPQEIRPLDQADDGLSRQYLTGTATYNDAKINLLDLSKVLTQGELVVDEVA
ncbi:MAG: chemotaxis protein CheW [Cyanobacteria bacterium P01_A01_bin.114]